MNRTLFACSCLLVNVLTARSFAQTCASPTALPSCTSTQINLDVAPSINTPAPACGGGGAYGIWLSFTAGSSKAILSASALGTLNGATAYMEAFDQGSCGATLASLGCATIGTGLTLTNLTVGQSYRVRVFTASQINTTGSNGKVNVTYAPGITNDEPANATLLSTYTSTTTSTGTLAYATASASISGTCATQGPDVYYRFVAQTSYPIITVNPSTGSTLTTGNTYAQLLSGTSSSLTPMACTAATASGSNSTITTYATPLTIGQTYYIRVFTTLSSANGCNYGFSVGVTEPIPVSVTGSRKNEIFKQTILSPANQLNDPWEVTYSANDGFLYITEAKGYKVYRMDPATSEKTTILDVSYKSIFLPLADTSFDVQFNTSQNPWPQGGFAGLALHPNFMDSVSPKNFVYVSYVHKYLSTATNNAGVFFSNRIVRFTYDPVTKKLGNPISICDTLPGSSDHNSQRMIIAPVSGTNYLFYAAGDMGAGQFANLNRPNHAQDTGYYEGKILRFNLDTTEADPVVSDKWIPNDNPFNGTTQSAVWATGMRNNQGFGYAVIGGVGRIYGSSHGPFSDDEINIIKKSKNYGHPMVIGYKADGNYNGAKAGPSSSSLPLITSESIKAGSWDDGYSDPIYCFYSAPKGTTTTTGSIQYIYSQVNAGNQDNSAWPSEAPSGMEVYTKALIPGWKNSILQSCLKGGRIMRLPLSPAGDTISYQTDTITYFRSVNRFRDVAISPTGKDIFAVIDKSSTTSGPTTTNPMVSACAGCLIKYSFLGYGSDGNGKSSIPSDIGISSTGLVNNCNMATTITIDDENNQYWVPITGDDGKILAEIKANGNSLGVVTTSYYLHNSTNGTLREDALHKLYLNRNLTITPTVQPRSPVSIRLYLTTDELAQLAGATNSLGVASGVSTISTVSVFKNSDACQGSVYQRADRIAPIYAENYGTDGYVLQTDIPSFSSFYIASSGYTVLPLDLISFTGQLQKTDALLQWVTDHESNLRNFEVERSEDASAFIKVGVVNARNLDQRQRYNYLDAGVAALKSDFVYYRLRMVDLDGSYKYSQVIRLKIEHPAQISLYPNPASEVLHLQLFNIADQAVTIEVIDLQGRIALSVRKAIVNGGVVDLPVKSLPNQFYIVKLKDMKGNMIQSAKFEKIEK